MFLIRLVLIATATLWLSACNSSGGSTDLPPADKSPAFSDQYLIGVGDQLRVDVWRNPELSATVPLRPDGKISLPLIGDVMAGGLTPEEVAAKVAEDLSTFVRDPKVSVIVVSVGSAEYISRVRVTGAVQSPRSMPFRPGMTVLDVILDSGGLTEFANGGNARLYRGDDSFRLDLDALLNGGKAEMNVDLRPGDIITVPESAF